MNWLFFQTLIWLLLALLLGLVLGWLLRGIICPCKRDDELAAVSETRTETRTDAKAGLVPVASNAEPGEIDITDNMRPMGLSGLNGEADDLKRIKGVGPVIQKTLNELGIFHFSQVSDFTRDNISWVDNYISFPGRIDREGWVSQARDLSAGVKTEFASRYDRGEVGENNPNN